MLAGLSLSERKISVELESRKIKNTYLNVFPKLCPVICWTKWSIKSTMTPRNTSSIRLLIICVAYVSCGLIRYLMNQICVEPSSRGMQLYCFWICDGPSKQYRHFWMSELMTCSSLDGSVKSHLQPGRKQADSNAHTSPEWLLVPTFIWALPSHGLSSSTAIPKKTKGDKGEKRSSEKIKPQVLV